MNRLARSGRVNLKLLVILGVVVIVLIPGTFAAWKISRRVQAKRALKGGLTAFEHGEWSTATRQLHRYLSSHGDDVKILEKYAEANLSVRPLLTETNLIPAINAYRRMLRYRLEDSQEEVVCRRLASLYFYIRDFDELKYVADRRLEHASNDPEASLWLAQSLTGTQKHDQAADTLVHLIELLTKEPTKTRDKEFIDACILLNGIAVRREDQRAGGKTAREWLDLAVKRDPTSATARLARAKFLRLAAAGNAARRDDLLAEARDDLERTDDLNPTDPRIRLDLAREWTAFGEYDRASSELDAVKTLGQKAVEEHFIDPNDALTARLVQRTELALRTGELAPAIELTDYALGELKERHHRFSALPAAIRLYVVAKRVDDARECLKEYLDISRLAPPGAVSRESRTLLQAAVAHGEGKPYEVINLLEPLVAASPDTAAFWQLLADAYSQTNQSRLAISSLVTYLRLRPDDNNMTLQLAHQYLRQRNWRMAYETARVVSTRAPDDLAAQLIRIEGGIKSEFQRSADAQSALLTKLGKDLDVLRQRHGKRVEIRLLQAILAVGQNRLDDAVDILKHASEECTDPLPAQLRLAQVYQMQKRSEQAIELARAVCKQHPDRAAPWQVLSGLLAKDNKTKEAVEALRTGLDTVGDQQQKRRITLNLIMLELTHGNQQEGIRLLEGLAQQYDQDTYCRSMLLRLPTILKDKQRAANLIDQIHRIEGDAGIIWRMHQASLWLADDQWREKEKEITALLEQCIKTDPEWSLPHRLLARMYERLAKFDLAEQAYQRALSANPGAIDIAVQFATFLEGQGRFAEAKKVLDELEVKTPAISSTLALAAIGTGQFDEAIRELELVAAGNTQDAGTRVALARLIYYQTKDAKRAFELLDQAQAVQSDSASALALRVAILKSEKKEDQARSLLDENIKRNTFNSYLVRGTYLASIGELDAAEKDYRRLTTFDKGGEGFLVLGKFYARNKRIDDAVTTWDEGIAAHPENLPLKRTLASALLARNGTGDRARAAQLLDALKQAMPDDPETLWLQAILLFDQGPEHADTVRQILGKIVDQRPLFVDAHIQLINLAMQQGDYQAARDAAIRAERSNPNNSRILLAHARAEQALNNHAMARALAQMVLKNNPNNANAIDMIIRTALSTRDPNMISEATGLVKRALSEQSDSDEFQLANAMLLNAANKPDQAIAELERHCRTKKDNVSTDLLLGLAKLHRLQGNLAACNQRIDQAEKQSPGRPDVVRERILYLGRQRQFDDIVALITNYSKAHGDDLDTVIIAAQLLGASGKPSCEEEAAALFEQVIRAAPKRIDARIGLAWLAYRKGDTDRAEATYRGVLEDDPRNVDVLNDLAWILADNRHKYTEALELADQGVQLAPDRRDLHDTRGVILMNLPGRLQDARIDFAKCVELTLPDTAARAKALLQLARVCSKLNEPEPTRQHLERALAIDKQLNVFSDAERNEIRQLLKAATPAK